MTSLEGDPNAVKLDFLQPLVHYIKPIFAASSAPEHAAALSAAQAYLEACFSENQIAVRKLAAEKSRLHQVCQAPQYEGRYCSILCRNQGPTTAGRHPGHYAMLSGIEVALKELAIEESLINLWRVTLGQPLHCMRHQSYRVFYAPEAEGSSRHRVATRAYPTTVVSEEPAQPVLTTASQQQPVNLARPSSVSIVTVCSSSHNAQ